MEQLDLLAYDAGKALAEAKVRADEAIARVVAHAEEHCPGWTGSSLDWIESYAKTHRYFPMFECRNAGAKAGVPKAHDDRAWGGPTQAAKRRNIIADSGDMVANPERHGVKTIVWQSLVYQGGSK